MDEFLDKLAESLDLSPGSVSPHTTLENLRWDSLATLTCVIFVEEEYGVALSADDFRSFVTVDDVFKAIRSRL